MGILSTGPVELEIEIVRAQNGWIVKIEGDYYVASTKKEVLKRIQSSLEEVQ